MDFDEWLDKAWKEHATDAAAVATQIVTDGAVLAKRSDDIAALARLTHHVYGEHLAWYGEGRALLSQFGSREHSADVSKLLQVLDASLALSANVADDRPIFDAATRIRITALAAGNLVVQDSPGAGALLTEAVTAVDAVALDASDPACRALAITGNNMACALEELLSRTDAQRALMIFAAQTARKFWMRAGTWLEIERAEYRLAQTWRHAGDLVEARRHAQQCLEIVGRHGSPALEAFFGWEVLALVERDAGSATGHSLALANARAAFERLVGADQERFEASLVALGT